MTTQVVDSLRFDKDGLIPAVVQDRESGSVLTLAYMNRESLRKTLETGETHFWSRSRQSLWHKGETSGHTQRVWKIAADCDNDALLIEVDQTGNACHTGAYSCFFTSVKESPGEGGAFASVIGSLARVIRSRNEERPTGSYTVSLFEAGTDRILKKIAEESGETIVAAKNHNKEEIVWEASDLLYHLLVLLESEGVPLSAIAAELSRRTGTRREQ